MVVVKRWSIRALASKNAILHFFTISKSNFITYTIPFYNSTHIKKLYPFTFSLKYYFLIFLYYIFSITTFFSDSIGNIFLGFWPLFFFFPDLHSPPTLLNFVFCFSRLAFSSNAFELCFFFFSRLAFSNGHIFLGHATLFFFPTVMLIPVAFPWPLSFLSNSDVFSNGDTEIQRTKRENKTEVPDNGKRNFGGKKDGIKFFFFFLELCYNIILKLELYCSTIAKFFAIVRFTILWCRHFWAMKYQKTLKYMVLVFFNANALSNLFGSNIFFTQSFFKIKPKKG